MLILDTRPTILQNETIFFNMKTILSTVLLLLSSFFVSAQDFFLIVESDNCYCAYFEVVGEEIEFFDVQFQISGSNGYTNTINGNPYELCDFFDGDYIITATVSSNGNIFWTGEEVFYICLLYTSPSPRDQRGSRMPSSA